MKNTVKIVLFLFVILISQNAVSQKTAGKYIQFKMYKNVNFDLGLTQSSTVVTLGSFLPAIAWGKNENFHEIQLTSIEFQSRSKTFSYSTGLEYTYNYRVTDQESNNFQLYMGAGVGSGFNTVFGTLFDPSTQTFNNSSGKYVLFHAVVIPRVTYKVKSNILLDLSVPYHLYDFKHTNLTLRDPSVTTNGQTTIFNDNTFLPRILDVKLGATVIF